MRINASLRLLVGRIEVSSVLTVDGVSVSYGGNRVLTDVSCSVEAGTLVGLIGPNGAGKTTLLGVLSGLVRNSRGRVHFDEVEITKWSPDRRARIGMARTFQRLELWNSMSVADNIQTAAELSGRRRGREEIRETTETLIDRFGLREVRDARTAELPSGLSRVTEVARALACDPKVLLLDEPSAGLDDSESAALADTLRGVVADGVAILLVEHHVEMVMNLSSKVYVLDFGRVIAEGDPETVRGSDVVKHAYLGFRHAG
jgi:branched-chain amino acid transport system ATP-binding protein